MDSTFLSEDEWRALAQRLRLAPRELQVAKMVLEGADEATTARTLGISPHTVHTYRSRLCQKLHVADRCGVIACLFRTYVELIKDS